MTPAFMHNLGAFVAIATSIAPVAATANINGTAIDRFAHHMPLSCILHQTVGAATGAPATVSAQAKLQDSADGVNFADYVDPQTSQVAQTAALAGGGAENSVSVDLSSARRWIRAVELIALTGGNAPTLPVAVDIALGGERYLPAG